MAVTRIKNNQITDSTITYAKIATGTLVGSNFNPNLTLNSNVSIVGNLTVTGVSSTVSSTNTYVNDPLVVFNNGYVGSLSGYDIGILVNRNLAALAGYGSVNTAWIWNEADAAFEAIVTTDTGGGITSINNSGFANVKVGNLTANSLTITTGTLSVPTINSQFTGNAALTYDTATNFSTGNAQISGGNGAFTALTATNFSSGNAVITGGNIVINYLTPTNISTGNAQITGGNSAWTTATATNFSTGNASISGGNGAFTTLTATNFSSANINNSNGAFTTLTATNFSTANASISGGNSAFTTATATNFSTANASITGGNAAWTTETATNFSSGNAVITGGNVSTNYLTATNIYSGNITGTFNGTTATANVALYVNENATSTNQNYYVHLSDRSATSNTAVYVGSGLTFNPSTNNLATTTFTGTFSGTSAISSGSLAVTTATATNFSSGNAQITGGNSAWTTATATNFSSANISNSNGAFTTLTATNFSSGNAQITGGNGAFTTLTATNFSSANISNSNGAFTTLTATNLSSGNAQITGGNAVWTTETATNFSSGNAQITGGNGAFTTLTATNFSSANISNSNGAFTTLTATNLSSGNAQITGGNSAWTTATATNFSSGNAVITGGSINGASIGATTASTGKFTTIVGTSTTDATSTTTGALQVAGGVGIVGNLWVGGNIYAANIIATVQNQLTVTDPLVYFNATSPSPYNYDIGFYSDFTGGPVNVYGHSGMVRKQSANAWVFFSNIASEPTATSINWADAGIIYDAVIAGNIVAANTTTSSSTTTGALIVAGGAGIAGQVYAGGFNTSGGSVLGTATATNFSTANASISGGNAAFTTLTSTNFSTANASVSGGNAAFTTLTATNFSTANASISGGNGAFTTLTATNLSSANITGTFNGTVVTSNVALYEKFTATSTNQSYYPVITDINATGNAAAYTQTGLTFNPSTNNLTTTTFTGTFSGTASITSGSIAATTIAATNFSSGNAVITGGNITTNYLTPTNLSTANAVITGGNITINYLTPTNLSTANAVITGGSITGMNGAFTTLTATNFSSANISNSNGAFTTLTATNFSTGNASISGGNGAFTTLTATNFSSANISNSNGAFTTLTATNFSTGNASISGGNSAWTTATATNFSSGNARITGGYADAFPIGANTAATGAFTTLTASGVTTLTGNLVLTSTQDTTAPNIGALVIPVGGISVTGNAYVGQNLYVGPGAFNTTLTTPTVIAVDNGSTYAQMAIKNASNTGSADLLAYGNNYAGASNDHGWVDVGFTGDAFNDPNYTITKPNDGYVFASAANSTVGGNLVLSTDYTGSYNDIVIGVGSFNSTAEVARFHGNVSNNGTFTLKLPTNAIPAANTGAMQVWGGASIGSNVYVGGATTFGGTRAAGGDHIVQGKNDASLLWAKSGASYDQVLIGNSATMSTLVTGAKLQINSTDSILLPVGSSAQRPGSSGGTDTQGMLRYSTTTGAIEWYTGTSWQTASTSFTVIADQQFNGDGTTTVFTLSDSQTTNSCIVSINGVIQIPTLAYAVTGGTTLTFTEAPASGDVIDVRKLTTTSTVTGLSDTTGYNTVEVSTSGVVISTGTVSKVPAWAVDTSGALVPQKANVSVATANTATAVDSFATATYRSAKYIIQATAGGKYQVMEALVVHDDTTPSITAYGIIQTSGNVGTVTATISSGTLSVNFVAANINTYVRISKEYILI